MDMSLSAGKSPALKADDLSSTLGTHIKVKKIQSLKAVLWTPHDVKASPTHHTQAQCMWHTHE